MKMDYKVLIFVPVVVLILSSAYLVSNYMVTGEFFKKSIELKGGTIITVSLTPQINDKSIEKLLAGYDEFKVRKIKSVSGNMLIIELPPESDTHKLIERLSKLGIEKKDISLENIGPALGASFWRQSQIAIIIAFVMMGIIVFFIFRTFIPSLAVMLSAASDIIVTIAIMQILGIELSLAGLAALLMLIGYSVDTDILLTTRLIKEEGKDVDAKLKRAMKTGLTMSFTTIGAVTALLASSISSVLSNIANVLLFGLLVDLMNTWMQNAGILKWYIERKVSA
ncbi:MAG: protein translocase subunit SecF [Candidatus Aenigmatarchaeota archaeon]|nr:MAG: protein translocase subunit SecF [Candidatus Aenigmarchaeota archaeon]